MAAARYAELLALLGESYDKPAWHGPNLRGSLRGLSAAEAAWRPGPRRHSIWEIALHCAYWEHATTRRLTEGKRGAFPRSPSNFPRMPAGSTPRAWKEDLALLDETHRRLMEAARAAAADVDPEAESGWRALRLLRGIASHNVYHAGQIRLLIRLSGAKRRS